MAMMMSLITMTMMIMMMMMMTMMMVMMMMMIMTMIMMMMTIWMKNKAAPHQTDSIDIGRLPSVIHPCNYHHDEHDEDDFDGDDDDIDQDDHHDHYIRMAIMSSHDGEDLNVDEELSSSGKLIMNRKIIQCMLSIMMVMMMMTMGRWSAAAVMIYAE